jgi:hydroxyquinol 1,2-dioxygenase
MRDFNEHNVTDAVLERFENMPEGRGKQIMSSFVRHLHDFVKDVEPTVEEWGQAIDYLTRTGKMCTDKRQEFILLSDTLGVSMLVDAINHRARAGVTDTTVMGPFYVENPPERPLGYDVANNIRGEPLYLEGTVASDNGSPIPNAAVDIWHSDSDGFYDVQYADRDEAALRARFRTDASGRFYFWTIMPTFYPVPYDGTVGEMLNATARHPYRPAHVHFMISAEGHETLVTHLFVAEDQYLDSDAVFAVKSSLIQEFPRQPAGIAPDGREMTAPWRKLSYGFSLKPN